MYRITFFSEASIHISVLCTPVFSLYIFKNLNKTLELRSVTLLFFTDTLRLSLLKHNRSAVKKFLLKDTPHHRHHHQTPDHRQVDRRKTLADRGLT